MFISIEEVPHSNLLYHTFISIEEVPHSNLSRHRYFVQVTPLSITAYNTQKSQAELKPIKLCLNGWSDL